MENIFQHPHNNTTIDLPFTFGTVVKQQRVYTDHFDGVVVAISKPFITCGIHKAVLVQVEFEDECNKSYGFNKSHYTYSITTGKFLFSDLNVTDKVLAGFEDRKIGFTV